MRYAEATHSTELSTNMFGYLSDEAAALVGP